MAIPALHLSQVNAKENSAGQEDDSDSNDGGLDGSGSHKSLQMPTPRFRDLTIESPEDRAKEESVVTPKDGSLDGSGSKKMLQVPTPRLIALPTTSTSIQEAPKPEIQQTPSESVTSSSADDEEEGTDDESEEDTPMAPLQHRGLDGSGSRKKLRMPTPKLTLRTSRIEGNSEEDARIPKNLSNALNDASSAAVGTHKGNTFRVQEKVRGKVVSLYDISVVAEQIDIEEYFEVSAWDNEGTEFLKNFKFSKKMVIFFKVSNFRL